MADDWNKVWQERANNDLHPDPWLLKVLPLLPLGRVLDLACGRGRNALFLAEHGYAVTAVDASGEALAQVAAEAQRRGLQITQMQQDLEQHAHLALPPFDLVVQFFYLQRSLLPELRRLVRPGGVAVVRTFSHAGDFPGGPGNPDFALAAGELLRLFGDWQVLIHEEGLDRAQRGGGLAGIVVRRPPDGAV